MDKTAQVKLPGSCWECGSLVCKLPFSKVIPGRKRMEYAYKRHPKCNVKDIVKINAEE